MNLTGVDVREMLWNLRRYLWVGLLPFVLAMCVALVTFRMTESKYESRITVALIEQAAVSKALEPLVPTNPGARRENYAVSVAKLDNTIHSRPFLIQIAQRTGMAQEPALLQEGAAFAKRQPDLAAEDYALRQAVGLVQDKIRVDYVGPPYVRVSTVDKHPAMAQKLAAAVGEVLVEESRRTSLERSGARQEFSAQQVDLYERKLRASEEALRNFEERLIERRASMSPVTGANLEIARSVRLSVEGEIAQVQERLRADGVDWRSRSSGAEPPALGSPRTQELESLLAQLEVAHALAMLRSVAGNEDATALKGKIGDTRQRLFTEYQNLAGRAAGESPAADRDLIVGLALGRSILRSLERTRNHLDSLFAGQVRELRATPGEQLRLERLRSEVQMHRDVLAPLRKEASSSEISQAMEASELNLTFEIVETAQLPLAPVWPDRSKILGGAALLGVLLAAGVVMLARRFGATFASLPEVELEIGAPVLGTIPRVYGWHAPGSYWERHWALVSILFVLLATLVFHVVHPGAAAGRTPAAVPHAATR